MPLVASVLAGSNRKERKLLRFVLSTEYDDLSDPDLYRGYKAELSLQHRHMLIKKEMLLRSVFKCYY